MGIWYPYLQELMLGMGIARIYLPDLIFTQAQTLPSTLVPVAAFVPATVLDTVTVTSATIVLSIAMVHWVDLIGICIVA